MYETDDIIYALATAAGTSALAIIRVSGAGCTEKVAKIFSRGEELCALPSYHMLYGKLYDCPTDEADAHDRGHETEAPKLIEEVMISRFVAPHGYTGEEALELSLHGSMISIRRVSVALRALGLRQAEPGEFSFRAFMNGRMELTQVEAVHELIKAKTEKAQDYALRRLQGELGTRISQVREELISLMMPLSLSLDYPEEELDLELNFDWEALARARRDLEEIANSYKKGQHLRDGYRIVLAGETNAGKSSVFNKLIGQNRAIVSPIAGTTRDYLESWIELAGMPLCIIDTAGLRHENNPTGDIIEARGIEHSNKLIEEADLLLYVVDNSAGLSAEDSMLIDRHRDRCIVLCNKSDLASRPACPEAWKVIDIQATSEGAILELEDYLTRELESNSDDLVLESPRQAELITRCFDSLEGIVPLVDDEIKAMHLRLAIDSLSEMLGEISTEDIFDRIFSHFCVGK